jgi:hypothetical protein
MADLVFPALLLLLLLSLAPVDIEYIVAFVLLLVFPVQVKSFLFLAVIHPAAEFSHFPPPVEVVPLSVNLLPDGIEHLRL